MLVTGCTIRFTKGGSSAGTCRRRRCVERDCPKHERGPTLRHEVSAERVSNMLDRLASRHRA